MEFFMAAPIIVSPNADLDYLLEQVAVAIQLQPAQYRLAAEHYGAVGKWLSAPGSPLERFRPSIFPQGSMALETTVRPLHREEYDLDLVCQFATTGMTAMEVYNSVHSRLMAHGAYAPQVEKKNRCVRINYAHEFHLDIIPAQPDIAKGGEAIQVPDRALQDWSPSNPKGYIAWFANRSKVTIAEMRKRLDPLPHPTPAEQKPPLTIAVQLMKRRRDMTCDADVAPRSIVLTTLAAENYSGVDCVLTALTQIVAGIQKRIHDAKPGRIVVCNPTNLAEQFCESFAAPGRYDAFTRFIEQLESDLREISRAQGIPALERVLAEKFGIEEVKKAIEAYGTLLRSQRDGAKLKFAAGNGLSIVTGYEKSQSAPRNTNFGGGNAESIAEL
jgi:hypothetical protein